MSSHIPAFELKIHGQSLVFETYEDEWGKPWQNTLLAKMLTPSMQKFKGYPMTVETVSLVKTTIRERLSYFVATDVLYKNWEEKWYLDETPTQWCLSIEEDTGGKPLYCGPTFAAFTQKEFLTQLRHWMMDDLANHDDQ